MDFSRLIKEYSNAPISRHVLLEVLSEYKRPNDKISELIKNGELVSLRRGLYLPGPETGLPIPASFLIANHLHGPKTTKKIKTSIGRFGYQHLPSPYYSFGIKCVELSKNQLVLLASPEKAICDKIVLTPIINLRSIKQTRAFLLEDLRIDEQLLRTLNLEMMSTWLEDAPKKNSIKMLISTIKEL
ncbi:MAG: hypothetical protein RL762_1643 [Bacteroidota bacterium]